MSAPEIGPGYFETTAAKSARRAMIRNALVVLFFLGWMVVSVTSFRHLRDATGPLAVEAALAALGAWRFFVALGRRQDVTKHPVFRDFAGHGEPRAVAAEIESAVGSGRGHHGADVLVTDRFLVALGIAHDCIALEDIAWVYVKHTSRSINFIPVGTTSSLELFTYSSRRRFVSLSLTVDSITMTLLRGAATRARFGYSPENEKWWKTTRLAQAGAR